MMNRMGLWAVTLLGSAACAADAPDKPAADTHAEAAAAAQTLTFTTDPVHVPAGEERFLCYAAPLTEDAVIDGYTHAAQPFVHHVVFARTLSPEPDGLSECDVLFRSTWDPLFITGAGSASLKFPDGVGHTLKEGTQLLVQLHLLNASDHDVEEPVSIQMHRSPVSNPTPVGTFVMGSTDLHLPASQPSEVQGTCEPKAPVKLIAAFPHMHWLGRSLTLEVGKGGGEMQTIFTRDPYNFDDQHIETMDLELSPGDQARVTCHYENDTTHEVGFGESTTNEMCFFVGFALGQDKLQTCLARSQPKMQ